jgi:hypothetical protein
MTKLGLIQPAEARNGRYESILTNECKRCKKNSIKIVAKNESLQKLAHCDVGLKAVFRSIRRLCIDQLKSLKGIESTKELHQHLADLIKTRCGYT